MRATYQQLDNTENDLPITVADPQGAIGAIAPPRDGLGGILSAAGA